MKQLIIVSILILAAGVASLLDFKPSTATEATWLNSTLDKEVLATYTPPQPGCVEQWVMIADRLQVSKVCVYQTNGLRYGLFKPPGLWFEHPDYYLVVSYPGDLMMYPVIGNGIGIYDNRLPVLGYDGNDFLFWDTGYWKVVRDVKSKLKPVKDILQRTTHYELDNPEILFWRFWEGAATNIASAGMNVSYGLSSNRKWLVLFNSSRAAVRVNLEDYSARLFTSNIATRSNATVYSANIAVSNDGQNIAVMRDVAPVVFKVADTCGIYAKDTQTLNLNTVIPTPCDYRSLENIIGYGYDANHGTFNKTGNKLTLQQRGVVNSELDDKWIRLSLSGVVANELTYLALGDSFSSGEGDTDDKYYLPGTNEEHEKCHLSTRSYPFQIANELGIQNDMKSVACSGAMMKDINSDNNDYSGQGGRLVDVLGDSDKNNIRKSRSEALQKIIPGRTHQLDFVEEYMPKVVTIGIGGNDVDLVGKLIPCLDTDECHWVTDASRPKVANEIKNKFSELVATYKKIQTASPGVKLYVIGYPKIFDQDNNDCGFRIGNRLSYKEREFGNQAVSYLNQVIAAAARSVGARYIDNTEAIGDKKLCSTDRPHAVNGIAFGGDTAVGDSENGLRIVAQESFHPNPLGFDRMRQSIRSVVPDITTYIYCVDPTTCATGESAPEPSAYWHSPTGGDKTALSKTPMIKPTNNKKNEAKIQLPDYSARVAAPLDMTVYSQPISLGQITTNEHGGYDGTLQLPADLEPGYHTLHLKGESYSGEPIEFYQIFIVKEDGTYTLPEYDNEIVEDATASPQDEPAKDVSTTDDTSTAEKGSPGAKQADDTIAEPHANNENFAASTEPLGQLHRTLSAIRDNTRSAINNMSSNLWPWVVTVGTSVAIAIAAFVCWHRKKI